MPFKHLGPERAVLLSSAIFILYLGFNEKLNLYIHPRYIFFTTVISAIGLVVIIMGLKRKQRHEPHEGSKLSSLPLIIILGAAILIPARSLTSATVSQRSIDSGSIVTAVGAKPINTLFAGSSKGLKLSDWSRLLQANSDPSYYTNKPAKISGFVYDAGLGGDTVWLARFVLTCCAVDAQPVGIPVRIEGWQDTYEEDGWVEVEGQFQESNTANGIELVLIPVTVKNVEQPRNPYAN
jgi:putative membrane protein